MKPSAPRLTLLKLLHEANSSNDLIEKFGDRLFRDLATLAVLKQACVVLKNATSKEDRDEAKQEILHQTEQITRAIRSIGCGNYTSPIADATVLQLSSHATITLQRLRDDAEG